LPRETKPPKQDQPAHQIRGAIIKRSSKSKTNTKSMTPKEIIQADIHALKHSMERLKKGRFESKFQFEKRKTDLFFMIARRKNQLKELVTNE
jgi:hypothetical protein